jgi:hypothetical protein
LNSKPGPTWPGFAFPTFLHPVIEKAWFEEYECFHATLPDRLYSWILNDFIGADARRAQHLVIFTFRFQIDFPLSLTFDFVQPQPEPTADRVTLFADVILPLPLPKLYTYRVPYELNDQVVIGGRVLVQFGAKRTLSCIVAAVHETPPKEYQAKYILEFIDDAPVVTQPQLKLFRWLADYYMCTR